MVAASACARFLSCWFIVLAAAPMRKVDDAIDAAIALELIHSATLLHDDIIDGGLLRRGKPSAFAALRRRAARWWPAIFFSAALSKYAGASTNGWSVRPRKPASSYRGRGDGRPDAP